MSNLLKTHETFRKGEDYEAPEFRAKLNHMAMICNAVEHLSLNGILGEFTPGGLSIGPALTQGVPSVQVLRFFFAELDVSTLSSGRTNITEVTIEESGGAWVRTTKTGGVSAVAAKPLTGDTAVPDADCLVLAMEFVDTAGDKDYAYIMPVGPIDTAYFGWFRNNSNQYLDDYVRFVS